jgi:hypothetical protein
MITLLCLLTILCFFTSGAFSGMLISDEQHGYKIDIRDIFFAVFGFLLGLIFLVVLVAKVHG